MGTNVTAERRAVYNTITYRAQTLLVSLESFKVCPTISLEERRACEVLMERVRRHQALRDHERWRS